MQRVSQTVALEFVQLSPAYNSMSFPSSEDLPLWGIKLFRFRISCGLFNQASSLFRFTHRYFFRWVSLQLGSDLFWGGPNVSKWYQNVSYLVNRITHLSLTLLPIDILLRLPSVSFCIIGSNFFQLWSHISWYKLWSLVMAYRSFKMQVRVCCSWILISGLKAFQLIFWAELLEKKIMDMVNLQKMVFILEESCLIPTFPY